ncbi:hypothetical protein SLS56_009843 [Neofusicoccum ribis]|uniref:Uncharacterized protein n=1 Tax=Neofusicoccum ribis TaxID=45134 RepID=A0ABR3SG46_9PEZI
METTIAYGLDLVEEGCRFLRSTSQIIASHSQQRYQLSICYQNLAALQQHLEQERTEHASTCQQLEHERNEHSRTDSLLQQERLEHGAAKAELSWQGDRISALEKHSANAHDALQDCGKFADSLNRQLAIANGEADHSKDAGDPSIPRLADLFLELTSLRSTLLLLQENEADGRLCQLLEENVQLQRRNGELEKLVSAGSEEVRGMAKQLEHLNRYIEPKGKPDATRRSRRAEKVKEDARAPFAPNTPPK